MGELVVVDLGQCIVLVQVLVGVQLCLCLVIMFMIIVEVVVIIVVGFVKGYIYQFIVVQWQVLIGYLIMVVGGIVGEIVLFGFVECVLLGFVQVWCCLYVIEVFGDCVVCYVDVVEGG